MSEPVPLLCAAPLTRELSSHAPGTPEYVHAWTRAYRAMHEEAKRRPVMICLACHVIATGRRN